MVNKKTIWYHYKKAVGKLWGLFLFAGFIFGLNAFFGGVLVPVYYKGIIDALSDKSKYSEIFYFFKMFVLVGFGQYFLSRFYEYVESKMLSKAISKLTSYSLSELSKHSYQFFTNNFAGSLVNKIRKFVNSFETITDILVIDFLYAIVSVGGILIVLFKTSEILAYAALGWFILFFYMIIFFTRKRIPLEKIRGEAESRTTGVLADIVTNVLNLKIFSSKKKEEKYFDNVLSFERNARDKAWRLANNAYSINGFITFAAQSSLIFLSILLWQYGAVTAGTIVLVMSYSGTLFNRLLGLGSAIRRFFDAYTNAGEFVDIINTELEIKDASKPEVLKVQDGHIIFKDVSFKYKNGKTILENFNLDILPGKKIGLVGESGAGKTTITKILLRFADVSEGSVTIDGQDIRNITQDDLRSVISYVPQDPILFHRTLRENIAYGKPDATEEEILNASKEAHADEFIKNLSHGYETLVGERGVKLSGGERQRIAIARAILKNSPILVLDEATSSLDSVSEQHIKEALDRLMKNKTTIIVAHRLSTIEKMDEIIVLEKGKIVERGAHKDLLDLKGSYFNFWSHQTGGFIE